MNTVRQSLLLFSAVLFGLTGGLKLITSLSDERMLSLQDGLFSFLTLRQLMFASSVLELGVAFYILIGRKSALKLPSVIWLCAVIISYRLGMIAVDAKQPCACLGFGSRVLPISLKAQDNILASALAVIFLSSITLYVIQIKKAIK